MMKRSHYREEERQQLIPLINDIRKDHPAMAVEYNYIIHDLPLKIARLYIPLWIA